MSLARQKSDAVPRRRHAARICTLLAGLGPAAPALAHPHVFADVGLALDLDSERRVVSVDVTWRYDDFFSLLVLQDMGLDADGDGALTPSELESLERFDLDNWYEGFEGDLYLYSGGEKLGLGAPEFVSVSIDEGRITSVHRRSVTPTPAEGLVIEPYDPTYYIAFTASLPITLPSPCAATVLKPDLDAAARKMQAELAQIPEDQFLEIEPGRDFADRIEVTCGGS
ncbi:DUF1007 family protein [Salipiger mangrovisoli]|uniref:DUF1007 family protein n=1 Tax=Salipiger mangrovisoli TaxID=2865933 RepID=A0ABR9WYX4_9RHOB|nr:DUF1007 family protein [Salipiger mangrovisoli]MBE9636505.1 DUF1007 family protein [Salipiger mangrovisoli]